MTFKVNGRQASQGVGGTVAWFSFMEDKHKCNAGLVPGWSRLLFNIGCRSVMTEEYKVPDGMVGFSK